MVTSKRNMEHRGGLVCVISTLFLGMGLVAAQGVDQSGATCQQFPWETMQSVAPMSSFFNDVSADVYADDSYTMAAHTGGLRDTQQWNALADLLGMDGRGARTADAYYPSYDESAEKTITALLRPAMFEDELMSRITRQQGASDAFYPNVDVQRRDGSRAPMADIVAARASTSVPDTWHTFSGASEAQAAQASQASERVSVASVQSTCAARCERAVGRKSCIERCECQQLCVDAKEQDRCHRRCLQQKRSSPDNVRADGSEKVDAVGFTQRYRCYTCLDKCVVDAQSVSSAYTCQVSTCAGQCDRESIAWDSSSPCRTACLGNKEDYIGCITSCGD